MDDTHQSKAKEQLKMQSYAIDTNLGLIAMSLATIGIATMFLFYLSRKSGIFDVTPREVIDQPERAVRPPRRPGLRQPAANDARRGRRAVEFEADEDGALMVDPDSDDPELDGMVSGLHANMSKKERVKMEKKEEKKMARQAAVSFSSHLDLGSVIVYLMQVPQQQVVFLLFGILSVSMNSSNVN